jgi:hypothetical protein
MIDAELTVGAYLRGRVDTRVVGRTPSDTSGTWVTVTMLDGRAVGDHRSDHLVDYLLQFDIYAGGRPELWPLVNGVREALREMPGVHDGVVVTGVRFAGMARIPDTDFKPARERVILTATVWAHPAA